MDDDLKNITAFNEKSLTLGIPSKLFGACVALPLIIMVMMNIPLGMLLMAVLLIPLYIVHKDDSEASSLYISEMLSPDKYSLDVEHTYPIFIVDEDGSTMDLQNYVENKRNA